MYQSVIVCLIVGIILATNAPAANSLSSTKERENRKFFGGYRIAPKFCNATRLAPGSPKPRGPTICMFNHECSQRQGEVVGACMDGFLFGTCCLLKAEEEKFGQHEEKDEDEMMEEMPESNLAAVSSYERYGSASETHLDKKKNNQDAIDRFVMDSDMVEKYHLLNEATSYSYSTMPPDDDDDDVRTTTTTDESDTPTTNIYLPNMYNQAYSDELPVANRFEESTSDDFDFYTTREDDSTTNREVTDITDYPTTTYYRRTTKRPTRKTYAKPQFKPKPTKLSNNNNYVLVQTISNDRFNETKNDVSENNMESIESIILMLNDTNPGPSYDTGAATERVAMDSTEMTFDTTYYRPSTRFPPRPTFVTTTLSSNPYESKRPNLEAILSQSSTYSYNQDFGSSPIYHPSTNYISVSQSTSARPRPQYYPTVEIVKSTVGTRPTDTTTTTTTTTTKTTSPKTTKSTTKKTTTKRKSKPTTIATSKKPLRISTPKITPTITRKPPSTSYVYSPTPTRRPPSNKKTPTTQSAIITAADFATNRYPEYTIQSKPVTESRPSYIQIANSVTSERPSPTVHITPKPTVVISSTSYGVANRVPSTSSKPTIPSLPQGISVIYNQSPAILIPAPADFENEGYFGISTTVRPNLEHTVTQTSIYTIVPNSQKRPTIQAFTPPTPHKEIVENIPQQDFSHFPPVRNPGLNTTSYIGVGSEENDEIEVVTNNVLPTFVHDEVVLNKLDLLVSKIVASLQPNFNGLADMVYDRKNVTIVKDTPDVKPVTSTKKPPPTKKPTVQKKPTTRPKPQSDSPTTTKRPQKVSTKKPTATSKKPPTTKRPPTKVTTTKITTRPTKKVTAASTTESSSSSDSDYEESETAEDNEVESIEEPLPSFGNARIQCGVRPQVKSGRIVGGKAAQFGEWPWQVLVKESTWLGLFTKNKCGGVLVSNSYVMTAAHCQPGFLASLVAVMGEHDISGELEPKRSVTKNVKQIVVHRGYDPATFENDLALLQLETPVHYDTHIVPICLPPDTAEFTGRKATITGWGRLKYNGGVPSILQEVQVPIMENSVCQEMFHTAGHNKKILPSFLCAGYANGQRDSCEGDSGGPLVLQRSDGRYELVGTVSHGIKCAAPYLPGVYMRTTYYKPWIKSVASIK